MTTIFYIKADFWDEEGSDHKSVMATAESLEEFHAQIDDMFREDAYKGANDFKIEIEGSMKE